MTRQKRYHVRKPWVKFVHWCKDRCRRDLNYTGVENTLTAAQAEILWKRDNADGMKKPSLDRIDSTAGYIFNNLRFCEFAENIAKRNRENGPHRTMLNLFPDREDETEEAEDKSWTPNWVMEEC